MTKIAEFDPLRWSAGRGVHYRPLEQGGVEIALCLDRSPSLASLQLLAQHADPASLIESLVDNEK